MFLPHDAVATIGSVNLGKGKGRGKGRKGAAKGGREQQQHHEQSDPNPKLAPPQGILEVLQLLHGLGGLANSSAQQPDKATSQPPQTPQASKTQGGSQTTTPGSASHNGQDSNASNTSKDASPEQEHGGEEDSPFDQWATAIQQDHDTWRQGGAMEEQKHWTRGTTLDSKAGKPKFWAPKSAFQAQDKDSGRVTLRPPQEVHATLAFDWAGIHMRGHKQETLLECTRPRSERVTTRVVAIACNSAEAQALSIQEAMPIVMRMSAGDMLNVQAVMGKFDFMALADDELRALEVAMDAWAASCSRRKEQDPEVMILGDWAASELAAKHYAQSKEIADMQRKAIEQEKQDLEREKAALKQAKLQLEKDKETWKQVTEQVKTDLQDQPTAMQSTAWIQKPHHDNHVTPQGQQSRCLSQTQTQEEVRMQREEQLVKEAIFKAQLQSQLQSMPRSQLVEHSQSWPNASVHMQEDVHMGSGTSTAGSDHDTPAPKRQHSQRNAEQDHLPPPCQPSQEVQQQWQGSQPMMSSQSFLDPNLAQADAQIPVFRMDRVGEEDGQQVPGPWVKGIPKDDSETWGSIGKPMKTTTSPAKANSRDKRVRVKTSNPVYRTRSVTKTEEENEDL